MGKAADWIRKHAADAAMDNPILASVMLSTEEGRKEMRRKLSFMPDRFKDHIMGDRQPDNWARLHAPDGPIPIPQNEIDAATLTSYASFNPESN